MDWQAVAVSARLALATTAILLVVAVPLAGWLAFSRRRWTVAAEAVCVISNPKTTKSLVYELERRGILAMGPIFDS